MKKMKLFSFLLILLFFNVKIYSNTISNIAYLITSDYQKLSNEVKVEVAGGIKCFKEHGENIKEQHLTEENKITVVGELDLENFDTSFFYFKKKMYNEFYPSKVTFYIQKNEGEELIELEKDPKNQFQTKQIEIEGRKKYKVVSVGEDLKNTINQKEGYFSLEAFDINKSLGEVKNKLIISNKIIVKPNISNEEIQHLDSNRVIETKVDISFENLLKEKIRLKLNYNINNIQVQEVEGKLGDQLIKFYWSESDNCFYSEEILIVGDVMLDIIGKGVKILTDSKEEPFTLSVLIGSVNHGEITNKIILESQNRILLEKKSEQRHVRVGDLLKYTLDVTIVKDDSFKKFLFKDFLPRGFSLMEKSIKVNNGIVKNIEKNVNGEFSFEIDFNQKEFQQSLLTIEYIVRVGVTAKHGKNINRAIIYGDNFINQVLESNLASSVVHVDSENFSEKGIILGVIYLDLDKNNKYDSKKDITIPGIKIILENGDFAITDENGKYSIYGEDATTHIGKIDKKSLIKGIKGVKLTAKHSKNGESQFIDLKKAQLYAANFAFNIDDESIKEEIIEKILKRKTVLEEKVKEYIYSVESKELSFKGAPAIVEKKELGEIGIINNLEVVDFEKENKFKNKEEKKEKKVVIENLRQKLNILSAEEITNTIEGLDNSLDIMNISNGDVVPENMTFQIKGPSGGGINLYINGEEVDISHIGLRATSALNSLFFLEYSSVKLNKGKNIVKASFVDLFGVERAAIEKEVLVRGELSQIIFKKIKDEGEEEGIETFSIKGVDENGLDIPYSLNISIVESGGGEWISSDESKEIQGLQTTIPTNSEKIVKFKPKAGKQKVKFEAKVENIEKEFEFDLYGKTEELFVNGVLEGRLNFKGNSSENFFFEKKINNLYKDKLYYRGAVFAQGHVNDEYYLTMTYDSAKEDEKFFSYKDPEEYYPIYGDNSIKGYIGESRDDLYIKVERGESYVMYGDYKTSNIFDDRLRLNQYSRTLTGFSSGIKEKKMGLNTFIAKTSSEKVVEELQGEGISGPYSLSNRDILEGSEEIKLVVYNKSNGSIISETPLIRGQDYSIDYSLGRIYFAEPIMGYDLNFNPIFIKVNYELEDEEGEKHWVYGTNIEYEIKNNIILGGSYVKDENPMNEYEMNGVYALYDDKKNLLVVETSKTIDQDEGIGKGSSIFYKYENESLEMEAKYEKSDASYYNPDAKLSQGIERLDIEVEYEFLNKNILKFESELLKDELEGGGYEKRDLYLGLEFAKKGNFIYEVGGKHYYRSDSLETGDVNTIGAKIVWEPEEYSFIKAFLEYEQDILLSDKKRVAGGVDYSISEDSVIYLRQEFMSNLSDEYYLDPEDDSNRTLIGVKSKSYLDTEVFSEYREKNEDNGILPEVGYGIKKEFKLTEKLSVYGTFERIDPIIKSYELDSEDSESRKASTSITLGCDYEVSDISRIKGDLEFEFGSTESFLSKLAYGRKLTESLYFLGKNRYYTEGDIEQENRLILGLAYREHENSKYNSLNKYELNYSKNIIDDNYKQMTNILRSSHNYKFNSKIDTTLTLGIKNIDTVYEEIESNYTAYLIAGSFSHNIYKSWTTGINMSTIFDNDKNMDCGLGVEVGYIFESNLWLSVGYNVTGFKDKDFDPTGELNQGVYVRFRMNIGDIFDKVR